LEDSAILHGVKKSKPSSHIRSVPTVPEAPKPPVTEHTLNQAEQAQLRALDVELMQRKLQLSELAMSHEQLKQNMTQTAIAIQTVTLQMQDALKTVADNYDIDVESTTEKWTIDLKEMVLRKV
jgi:hypothetical protein